MWIVNKKTHCNDLQIAQTHILMFELRDFTILSKNICLF